MTHPAIIYADLDEMVFAERERDYGAYQLRKHYNRRLTIACLLTALIFTLASMSPVLAGFMGAAPEEVPKEKREVIIDIKEIPPPVHKPKELPTLPEPPKMKKIASTRVVIPDPTPADELDPDEIDNSIADQAALDTAVTVSIINQAGDDFFEFEGLVVGTGDIPDVIVIQEETIPGPGDWVQVDEEPKPVNMQDLVSCIKYPNYLSQSDIKGGVVVRILVDEFGHYQQHKVINQSHPALAKAVETCIDELLFTPAIQGGKPIKFWVNVPFRFQTIR